jgi:hypothetical protein
MRKVLNLWAKVTTPGCGQLFILRQKFVIATEVSKLREIKDGRKIFAIGKRRVESSPSYIITHALHAYESAFRKEFDSRRTAQIKTKSLSEGFANRPIERWHNEVREVIK